jgi:hypothetical protein
MEQAIERFVYLEAPPLTKCPDCATELRVVAVQIPDATPLGQATWVLGCPQGETMWEWRPVR